jgi:hypothetical protein
MNIKFNTKPYLPTLIASVLLFIMVFLPWLTVSFTGFGYSASASANGMHSWGILTFLMSIIAAAAAFVADKRMRALGSLVAGALALLGIIIYMAANLGNGAGVGVGLILALIVNLALIALAYMDLKGMALPIKMGGTPKSNPPPPPPAPPAPPAK